MSDDKIFAFTFKTLANSRISPLIAFWCSSKYLFATSTDWVIAVEIFLLNQPFKVVSKINTANKAIIIVGVKAIIEKVNNKKCTNLLDFRKYIKLTKNNSKHNYIELTTEINNTVALDIQELLKEEKLFAETYKYNLSNLYKHFNKTPKLNSNSLKRKTKLTKTKLTKKQTNKKTN